MKNILLAVLMLISVLAFSQSCDLDNEGFEGGTSFDTPGWTRTGSYKGNTTPNAGTYHYGFNTLNDGLTSPVYNNPRNLCYYWMSSGFTSDFDVLVQWSDDGGTVWNTFETISSIDTASSNVYRRNCLDLCAETYTNPTTVQFRFFMSFRGSGSLYLDDVCVSSGGCTITPTKLLFSSEPIGCTNINTDFEVVVCATDATNSIDNTYTGNITISKNSGTGAIAGTLTQTAVSGCASFSDIQFNAESNFTVLASDGSLTDAVSGSIEIKTSCPLEDTLTVVTYNLLNFPNIVGSGTEFGGCTYISNREDTLKKIMKYLDPDILMVCELQDLVGANLILNSSLNVDGVTKYAMANYVETVSSGDNTHNNMFYYNTEKVILKSQDVIITDLRDVSEYIVYGIDPNIGTHNDTTFVDFYETHLKAGDPFFDPNDSIRRIEEADSIRKYIDLKPVGRNNIIGGDFNFYTSTEEAYQVLCYQGTYPFVDPIAQEGDWNNNSAYASVHTQSTRASGGTVYDCGATGGTDDRFDFLLTSSNVISGANRVTYIPGTYTALGNNGTTFNGSVNDAGNTSSIPDSILNALYYMSDHLPVVMKVKMEFPNTNLSLETIKDSVKEEQEVESQFKFYPNPTSGVLNVTINILEEKIFNAIIYDIYGKIVSKKSNLENQNKIDLSDLNKGSYFIFINDGTSTLKREKIVLY